MSKFLRLSEMGVSRCWWCHGDAAYEAYHDQEWGRPVGEDHVLFEKLCLEAFQSGLSWLTILRKRENFRRAFEGFDVDRVASFGADEIERLMADAGIVRHRGKIEAVLNNARRAVELRGEFGSLAAYFWSWEAQEREGHLGTEPYDWPVPSLTKSSKALSCDLKKRGWKFLGSTTVYAFMQAMGMVNDHLPGCHCYLEVEAAREAFQRPAPKAF